VTALNSLRGNAGDRVDDRENAPGWRWKQSLGDGPAGTALLRLERGEDAREPLTAMLAGPLAAHPTQASLFSGAPAVAFTLAATGHRDVFAALDRHVEAITRARLDAAYTRIEAGELPAKREFDLIGGLSGLAAYLLRRDTHPGTGPTGAASGGLLSEVLAYLVGLTQPRPNGLPGWWAAGGPTGPGPRWAGGHGNLGVAHGISGVLAVLALAMRRGITVAGHADAIERVCRWLDRWRCGTGHRVWWPETISRADHATGTARQAQPPRPSWCYGAPGIIHAQHLAGLALGDPRRQRFAVQALAWTVADDTQLAQLSDVSVCHGWAGVLHTAWRLGEHDEQVRGHVPRLVARLTEHHQRHRDQARRSHGLLTGDAGVLLVQHAATTDTPPATRWDACLLLDA
jgi:hypothetical protein